MKFYAKIQRWCFYVGMVGLVTWVIMLLLTTSEKFIASFNSFMANTLNWGGGQAYQQILTMAQTNGFNAVPLAQTSFGSSFLIGPALAYTFMYIAWTGTLVGEIGGVNQFKNSLKMFVGGNLFAMVICAGFLWLLISKISNEFFTSSNFLWMSGNTGDMPVAPYYGIFLMSLSKSPWVWLWIAIGLNAWFWIWPTNNMVASTRIMFAMSYDRMLPGIVARVSRRWGAPIIAITICYIGCLVMGWLYFFTSFSKLTLDMPLMTSIAFCASTLVGTLFPYLKSTKKIYADSPISKYKVAGCRSLPSWAHWDWCISRSCSSCTSQMVGMAPIIRYRLLHLRRPDHQRSDLLCLPLLPQAAGYQYRYDLSRDPDRIIVASTTGISAALTITYRFDLTKGRCDAIGF